jgi:hypothetical protein
MKNFKSGIFIAFLGTLLAFFSVAYMSCEKPTLSPEICQDLICQNHGYCFSDTFKHTHYCKCSLGYEGDSCQTIVASRFLGNWSVTSTVTGSNNLSAKGSTSTYLDTIQYSYVPNVSFVPRDFIINSFTGNSIFQNVLCEVDSAGYVDNIGCNFRFIPNYYPEREPDFTIVGGNGQTPAGSGLTPSTITGYYYTRWKNLNYVNGNILQTDTVAFTMTRK